jgi:hypothetical protein
MATKAAEKAVEAADVVDDVKDLVEDSVDILEDGASWLSQNPKAVVIVAATIGVLSGGLACYLVVNSRLKAKYQKLADEQIADVKSKYTVQRVVEPKPSLEELAYAKLEEAVTKNEEIIESSGYLPYDKADEVVEAEDGTLMLPEVREEVTFTQALVEETMPRERNIFESDNADTYFDFEEELARREKKPNDPFVLTQEEFNENDTSYDQKTLTYYDGDGVLADEQDQPIDDADRVVGNENMLRFGHGSGDPNIVYIRNNRLELDFEVVHSDGKFAKEVLGYDDELKHSNKRPVRRFRPSDE